METMDCLSAECPGTYEPATSQENLSSGFATMSDSNQSAQLQKLARVLKFGYEPAHEKMYIMSYANNKGADQTARMRRSDCASAQSD